MNTHRLWVTTAALLSFGCGPHWRIRPAQSSGIEYLQGRPEGYRVCFKDASVTAAELDVQSVKGEAILRKLDGRSCAFFLGPVAKAGLETTSAIIVTKQTSGEHERVPLVTPERSWETYGKWDLETRLGLADTVDGGSGVLGAVSGSILYRLSHFGLGMSPSFALGVGRILLGWGATANATLALSRRWTATLEGEYSAGIISWRHGGLSSIFYHGPKAYLFVGWGASGLAGAPPATEQPAIGPFVGAEYLLLPNGHPPMTVVSAGWQYRF